MWQDFRGSGRFQVLALDFWNGSPIQVQGFTDVTGATFPVLRSAGFLSQPAHYGMSYENFLVIDADGIVRYASTTDPGGRGGWHDAPVRSAIIASLTVGIETTTWSGVKGLYR